MSQGDLKASNSPYALLTDVKFVNASNIAEENQIFLQLPDEKYIFAGDGEYKVPDAKQPVTTVTFAGAPTLFPFDMRQEFVTRITCFANAAILGLTYDRKLSAQKKDQIRALVEKHKKKLAATQGELASGTYRTELYSFQNELVEVSGVSAKDLAKLESLYVWQNVPPKTRVTRYVTGEQKLQVEQKETPLNSKLTDDQKRDLRNIHKSEAEQPAWFKKLPNSIKEFLKTIVPTVDQESKDLNAWDKYERFHPATLTFIPGERNSAVHELTVWDQTGQMLSHTQARRQGTPTAFDMPDEKRQESATQNLAQMLEYDLPEIDNQFRKFWDLKADDNIPCPILLEGLLTPSEQANWSYGVADPLIGKESNTMLDSEKSGAVVAYTDLYAKRREAYLKSEEKTAEGVAAHNFQFFNLNVAINDKRDTAQLASHENLLAFSQRLRDRLFAKLIPAEEEVKQQEVKMEEVKAVQAPVFGDAQRKTLQQKITAENDPNSARKKQLTRLQQLDKAITALENLNGTPREKGRNKNLYAAALYDVITRLMQGNSTANCKSSKDRNGVKQLMADAMLIFYAEKGRFPGYVDKGADRDRFVKIFCELYASGHQLLLAHDNSPGSAGIKDEGILDKDIKKQLGDIYTKSKELADLNKPGSFFQKNKWLLIGIGAILGAIILGVISAALCATGILSPVGLAGETVAAKLGAVGTGILFGVTEGAAVGAVIPPLYNRVIKTKEDTNFAAQQSNASWFQRHKMAITKWGAVLCGILALVLSATGVFAPLGALFGFLAAKVGMVATVATVMLAGAISGAIVGRVGVSLGDAVTCCRPSAQGKKYSDSNDTEQVSEGLLSHHTFSSTSSDKFQTLVKRAPKRNETVTTEGDVTDRPTQTFT